MLKKCLILLFALLLFLFLLFNNRNFPVSGDSFLGSDVRRFQTTKAWELAKAVEDNDLQEIKHQVIDLKVPVDTRDRINDFTPLMFAVFNNNIQSVKALLDLGADPNLPNDSISDVGENSVILACRFSDISVEILKLLLKYGGNPNSTECGRNYDIEGDWTPARCSALSYAISSFEKIEKIKFLVEAGADVNLYNSEYQDAPLMNAIVFDRMDMALYLLEHGADANCKFERFDKDGTPYYEDILSMLRECYFRLDSQEYKDKLKVIKILKDRGMDYWKTPVRENNIDEINNVMHFKTSKELQYYLKRY
jgi:ankyrin repeat protein